MQNPYLWLVCFPALKHDKYELFIMFKRRETNQTSFMSHSEIFASRKFVKN